MREDSSRRDVLKVAGAALAGAGIMAVSAGASPGQAQPDAGDEANFKDKVVALSCKDPIKGAYLQNVQCKKLAGRTFLVGKSAKKKDTDDMPEITYWFPIESVEMITVFNTIEDAWKAYDSQKKKDK
jgi:hypothetical protein